MQTHLNGIESTGHCSLATFSPSILVFVVFLIAGLGLGNIGNVNEGDYTLTSFKILLHFCIRVHSLLMVAFIPFVSSGRESSGSNFKAMS